MRVLIPSSVIPIALSTLTGCALVAPAKADVDVAHIAAAFPTIERLSAVVYMHDPGNDSDADCEYFEYGRGAFTSKPEDEFCRVFDYEGRHEGGGDEGPVPVPFDDQALADLATLKSALAEDGLALDYMNVVLAPDGSVAGDSNFWFDRCVTYWYQPGWTTLPEDDPGKLVSTAIDSNWYKEDGCP